MVSLIFRALFRLSLSASLALVRCPIDALMPRQQLLLHYFLAVFLCALSIVCLPHFHFSRLLRIGARIHCSLAVPHTDAVCTRIRSVISLSNERGMHALLLVVSPIVFCVVAVSRRFAIYFNVACTKCTITMKFIHTHMHKTVRKL